MIFDLQKNGALLAAGIAIGAAGSLAISGLVGDLWNLTPWSAESKLDRTRDQLADMTGRWRAEEQARKDRDVAIVDRDKRLLALGAGAALDQGDTVARWGQQCQAAYQSGVAFGRALSKTGGSNAATVAPRPAAAPAGPVPAGRVRESFRSSWSAGAFDPARSAPAGGLPGDRGG